MKRLVRKSSIQTLYHGTSFDNFKKIIRNGAITPNAESGAGKSGFKSSSGYVFLSTTMGKAEEYALQWVDRLKSGPKIVLEINLDDALLLPDFDDCPDCDNWEQSAEEFQQVSVEGSIDVSNISQVHFFSPSTFSLMFSSNIQNWEETYNRMNKGGELDALKTHPYRTYREYHNLDSDHLENDEEMD